MAYLALYRKYRPRDFDSVVGQEYVTRILKNQILSGRVGHAYLFSGIRGTGKTSTAKIFARAINCEHNVGGNPCNECETCKNIERPGVMDIIEIDGASNRGVDEIREIREKVKYPPTIGKYKVYIIDEVHMLTKEAFNALLKTLEEPPEHIVFILATTEPNKLPTTILSRCQRFDIKPISQAAIVGQMKKILADIQVDIEDDALNLIAYRGDSSMRDALSLLDQVIDIQRDGAPITEAEVLEFFGMADDESIFALTQAIFAGDKGAALAKFKAIRDTGRDSALVYDQLTEMLRRVLVVKSAGKDSAQILGLTEGALTNLRGLAQQVEEVRLFGMISLLIDERSKLKYSGLGAVVVEMTLLRLCGLEAAPVRQIQAAPEARRPVMQTSAANTAQRQPQRPAVKAAVPETPEAFEAVPPPEDMPGDLASLEAMPPEMAAPPEVPEAAPAAPQGASAQGAREGAPRAAAKGYRGVNTDKLYQYLINLCHAKKPMAVPHLQRGKLAEVGEGRLALRFNPDQQASVALLNMPQNLEFLKQAVNQAMKEPFDLKIEVVEKRYEEMSMAEKTRSIINDSKVEIVEVDGKNQL
ncbi:MAG: DNA polymerase III subunit gamma/tau [Eubacterium sp.]|nr:DNA polymerase III subunit gamma/tau [Eubacterium sp.]